MSTRYVWEKWNISSTYSESTEQATSIPCENVAYYEGESVSVSDTISSGSYNTSELGTVSLMKNFSGYQSIMLSSWGHCTAVDNTKKYRLSFYARPDDGGFELSYKWSSKTLHIIRYIDGIETEVPFTKGYIKTVYLKGSTSYGNVSSGSSGAYPANSYSGNYWYVSKGNDTIDPASVTYPASPNGGELVDITIAPSTGIKFGGTVKYKVEYQLDGGSWQTVVEATTATTVSVLIPKGTNTFTARATASDDTGFTSTDTVTGQTVNVVNNAAPVISCGTSSLGEIAEPFSVSYSVSDEDGDTMTITEKIDGTTIRSYSAPSGSSGEQTFNPSEAQWLTTLNGSHTATITAVDGKGGVTTHSISFTRAVYTMSVTLEEPMETDAAITKCVVNIARNLPADAEWSLLVTNNAFDPEPVWEDTTQYVKNGWNWVFENQTVTSGRYGFNFKLTCARGASGQGGSVDTISGGFE